MVCSKEAHLLRACHLNSSSRRSNRVAKRADLLPPLLNKAASTVHPVALPAMPRLLSGKFAPHQFTHLPIHCPFLSSPSYHHDVVLSCLQAHSKHIGVGEDFLHSLPSQQTHRLHRNTSTFHPIGFTPHTSHISQLSPS